MIRGFFDAFAGIGGVRLGMESAGFKCVGACEINERARSVYAENFGKHRGFHRDIHDIRRLPYRTDILCAGFPCTPFSTIGRRMGFEDPNKGRLFFELSRIMRNKPPKAVFLENVKQLVYHNGGKVFESIMGDLENIGYRVFYRIYNSANFGLPQSRERVYIVGFKSSKFASKFEFPDPLQVEKTIGSILQEDVSTEFDATMPMVIGWISKLKQRGRGHGGRFLPPLHTSDEVSRTLTKNGRILVLDGKRLRVLTPRECARLQGFPDSFRLDPIKTHAYRQLGNSVSVPVVSAIAKRMASVMS